METMYNCQNHQTQYQLGYSLRGRRIRSSSTQKVILKTQTKNQNKPEDNSSVENGELVVKTIDNKDKTSQYGQGHHPRKQPGEYHKLNDGLITAFAHCEHLYEDDSNLALESLSPDFALVAIHPDNPLTLDKALQGQDAKHWQEALQYKIDQLKKSKT